MREDGYIFKNSCEPTQKAMNLGLFRVVETVRTSSKTGAIDRTTKVTPKGQIYFVNKYTGHEPQQTINFQQ